MEQNIELDQEPVIIQQGGGAVNSVNGQTGDVVLTTSDIENTSDYQTGSEVQGAISTAVGAEATAREQADTRLDTAISGLTDALASETTARTNADTNLQSQIDGITASSDVTDIVGTYAELQSYDTSTLGDNDIVKVLQDESRNDETTYYRWSTTTQSFTLIGEEGPYYTKSQADGRFVAQTTYTTDKAALENEIATKQNTLTAGTNVTITGDVISATDTTYSDFTGTDGTTAGTAGLVPAPAVTDADKFLKSDGTWDTAGGGSSVNVVQAIGTSTTDVMSQDAVTKELYDADGNIRLGNSSTASAGAGPNIIIGKGDTILAGNYGKIIIGDNITDTNVQSFTIEIGSGASSSSGGNIAIGQNSSSGSGSECVAFGSNSSCGGQSRATAIGVRATAGRGGVALGAYSRTSRAGEVNIGSTSTSWGYNSTNYRVLGGVHAAVDDHDAVNLEQMNSRIVGSGTAAPTTSTVGSVGSLYAYVESGTGHLAICTDDTGGTYTWQTLV